jgi:hypothetical protein
MTLLELFDDCIPEPNSGCWIWMKGCNSAGYGVVTVNGLQKLAHKVSKSFECEDAIKSNVDVCHTCDNTYCINPNHLFLGDRSANMQDCSNKGRHVGNSRLTDEQVAEIRQQYKDGTPQYLIGFRFDISQAHVSNLCSGKRR